MTDKKIADYAMIGDGETAALVHSSGAIEWLCFPRFDSEACMAAILGDTQNGCWHFNLEGGITSTSRRYRGDSLILETELTCPGGTIRITDFMPIRGHAPDVVRIIECLDGEVSVTGELFLRFDYGRIQPLVEMVEDGHVLAVSGPDGISLSFDEPIEYADRRFITRSQLRQGDRRCFVLTWYPSHEKPPERVDADAALADTESYWRDWLGCMAYDGPHKQTVARSLVTLKAMIHRQTGGIVAAPTSSLPEWIGGERNWDYRYCWLRDAAFTFNALIRSGMTAEAEAWVAWLRRAVGGDPIDLKPFYTVTGQPRAIEWEADWLPGFAGSAPVRFGNGAQGQLQLDIFGSVLDCLWQGKHAGLQLDGACDALVRMIADELADVWQEPDEGIWESRGAPQHYTYSKVMCWVAFDRASRWFRETDGELARRYAGLAEKVRETTLERAWDEERQCFTCAFGNPALDAAVLRIPLVGFLPADDPRMAGTVAAIERELCENGLVRRYDPDKMDDGFDCPEGAFVAVCFWLAEVYHLQGREDDARALFDRLVGHANDLGLLSEEIEPKSGDQLGNFPQALSHLALVETALRLAEGYGCEAAVR